MSNLYQMPLGTISWLGLQHTRNLLAIASRLKKIQGQSIGLYQGACQSQKIAEKKEERLALKGAKGSWIFSMSDEYLAAMDSFGVRCIGVGWRVNDNARAWAD